VFSGQVPVGPFELQALPFVSGGDVRMVTTDASGRQVEVVQPYYAAPGLLRTGLSEYSFDIGAPRRNYGITSDDYDSIAAASGSYRYGLSDKLTLEGTTQTTSDGLRLGGFGLTRALGGHGAITVAGSASDYKSDTGTYYKVQLDTQFNGVRAYAGTERTNGDYYDLARVSLRRDALRREDLNANNPFERWQDLTARASAIDRAGMSFQPWFDEATSLNVSYNRIASTQDSLRLLNLSASRRLGPSVYGYLTAYRDLDEHSNYGVFATFTFSLGGDTRAALAAERSGGRNSFSQQITGDTGSGQGNADWMLSNREYSEGDAWRSASVGYSGAYADVRAQVDHMNGLSRVSGQLNGSFVAAGGDVFAASRIGDAFVIVREAGPGSEIRQNGARVARANSSGRALLPQMQPYAETTVTIDPTDLPVGWEPQATQRVVAAAWRQGAIANFGVKPSHGAVIVLHDKSGRPVGAGHRAMLEGTEQIALIGLDGEVYMKGLSESNRLRVDLGSAGQCTASFRYASNADALPRIGPLTCE
jgi:outer membrane usher protein